MAWVLIIGFFGSLAASIGWIVLRHSISQSIKDRKVAEVERRHAPLAERERARSGSSVSAPVAHRSAWAALARRDPDFDEAAFRAWVLQLHARLLREPEGQHPELAPSALQALRSGSQPFLRGLRQGRVELVTAYADELWANLELRVPVVLAEEQSESWRLDTLKLRRKQGQDWQLLHLESQRSSSLPKPSELPFGPTAPRRDPLPGAAQTWASTGWSIEPIEEVGTALRGEGLQGELAAQWALEERQLQAWSHGRSLELGELRQGPILECNLAGGRCRVELRIDGPARAWLHPPGRAGEGPELAAQRSLAARFERRGEAWALVDLVWMDREE